MTLVLRGTKGSKLTHAELDNNFSELDELKESKENTFSRKTANYTLAATDRSKIIEMNVAGSNDLVVPLEADVSIPIGFHTTVTQFGAGQTNIVASGGVTIRSSSGNLLIPTRYSPVTLTKVGTNEWYLFNGTTASGSVWQNWSASLVPTGFSAISIQKAWYKDDGNSIIIRFEISGTSNATTFNFSLPFALNSDYGSTGFVMSIMIINNNVTAQGRIYGTGGSSLLVVEPTVTGGNFVTSGAKSVRGFIVYQR